MSRKRKWGLRFFALVVVIAIGLFAYLAWQNRDQRNNLEAVRAKLDADDPGWRFEEIQQRRRANLPPDRENITLQVMQIPVAAEKRLNLWLNENEDWLPKENRTQLPEAERLAAAKQLRAELQPEIDRVLATGKMAGGGIVAPVGTSTIGISINHLNRLRLAAALMRFNAQLFAAENDGDNALLSCQALLNLSNGTNDEPMLITALTRGALRTLACDTLDRVLGYSEPKANLEMMQSALEKEANTRLLAESFRGERALMDACMEEIRAGNAVGSTMLDLIFPARFRAQHVQGLHMRTRILEIANGPSHEWLKQFHEMPKPNPGEVLIAGLVPSDEKAIQAVLRTQAKLHTAIVAVACERFRAANRRWPKSLDEIPKTILAQQPSDPYTGQPLKFLTTPTGVLVYSVGQDTIDDGGKLTDDAKPGTDIGMQLWSPEFRRSKPSE